jgi:D-sedoheptulose 7-phosphate isomerase
MVSDDQIRQEINDAISLRQAFLLGEENFAWIDVVAKSMIRCLRGGGKLIFAGNGGSMADAQHIAAEFLGRYMTERPPLAAHCLGTNAPLASAVSNDYAFEQLFARELEAIGKKEDVAILITTSGNSENLLRAAEVAGRIGMECYGLSGKSGGALAGQIRCLVINSDHTARIQEMHITIGHILCGLVDQGLGHKAGQ